MWNQQVNLPEKPYAKAFTLIELLVVIAIVALLAAILFPIFAQSREKARQSACLSNMKQIGTAFTMYTADSDGQYPTCDNDKAKIVGAPPDPETPDADGPEERDWHLVLQPYIKNLEIFRCGSDVSKKPKNIAAPDYSAEEYSSSYTVNGWSEYELRESSVTRPANFVLLAERNNVARPPKTWWMFYWWTWQTPRTWPPTSSPDPSLAARLDLALVRHQNHPNWLFSDGHVKSATLDSLWKSGKDNAFWPNPPE